MEIQWSLVLFTIIAGMGSCLYAFSVLQGVLKKGNMPAFAECLVAVVLLGIGGCISATHIIYHLDRIIEALNNPTSGIFVEAAGVGIMCVLIVAYFLMTWRKVNESATRVVALVGAVAGVLFAFICGNSYNMGGARPAWETYALPFAYCTTAVAAGAALNILMRAIRKEPEDSIAFAGKMGVIASVFGLVGCLVFGIGAAGYAFDASAENGMLYLVVMLVLEIASLLLSVLVWKKPGLGLSIGAATVVVAFFAGLFMRVFMWAVGTPLANFFLIPLE